MPDTLPTLSISAEDRVAASPLQLCLSFWQIPIADKYCFLAGWLLLGLAAVLIRILKVRHLTPLLGQSHGLTCKVPLVDARQETRARMVKRAIRRAVIAAPFRADCLPQALAGALLCRTLRVPFSAHLGVKLSEDKAIKAHAWLSSGSVAVTGGHGFQVFTSIFCFVFAPHSASSLPSPGQKVTIG
jgi:hypothetical protein